MDHIGYIVTGIEKEGFLRVTNVGGISPTMSLTRHVSFPNGVQGVVVSEVSKDTAMKDLFVDIGAQDKADAETMVQIGDVCVYANDCFQLGANRVASPAMDDRAACALLIRFLQTVGATKQTIIAVFSVQEEVGCRGAKVASFAKAPDKGIAIDVTAWGDTPGTKQPDIKLGEGIAVKVMDHGSISNPDLREALLAAGAQAGVKPSARCCRSAGRMRPRCRPAAAGFRCARCRFRAGMCIRRARWLTFGTSKVASSC